MITSECIFMKKYIIIAMAICFLTLTSAVYSLNVDDTVIPGLNITTDIEGAFNESQSQNKNLAIIFDQDSCVYCEMLKDDVLSNEDVQKQLNEDYIVLLVDINRNPDFADKYNVFGTPTVKFIDSKGSPIGEIEGYVDSGEFLKELKEI